MVVVAGYVAVVATQLVPSALKIVPVPVAIAGYVAVDQLGAAPVLAWKICPVEPVPNLVGVPDEPPYITSPMVVIGLANPVSVSQVRLPDESDCNILFEPGLAAGHTYVELAVIVACGWNIKL